MMFSLCSKSGKVSMSGRYEYARSGREKSVMLIFPEGTFEGLPFEVRLAAPWVGHGYGKISDLKPSDRRHFHQLGYAILRESGEMAPALQPEQTAATQPDHAELQQAA
jgi:hypothetical protein